MRLDQQPVGPLRRKLSEIAAVLVTVENGDLVHVVLRSDVYGDFLVAGRAFVNDSVWVGGIEIGSRGKPNREVVALEKPSDEVRNSSTVVVLDEIIHGAFLRVEFEQTPYGVFQIVGQGVSSSASDAILVGSWFVKRKDSLVPRVRSVTAAPRSVDDYRPVLPKMTQWSSDRGSPDIESGVAE